MSRCHAAIPVSPKRSGRATRQDERRERGGGGGSTTGRISKKEEKTGKARAGGREGGGEGHCTQLVPVPRTRPKPNEAEIRTYTRVGVDDEFTGGHPLSSRKREEERTQPRSTPGDHQTKCCEIAKSLLRARALPTADSRRGKAVWMALRRAWVNGQTEHLKNPFSADVSSTHKKIRFE